VERSGGIGTMVGNGWMDGFGVRSLEVRLWWCLGMEGRVTCVSCDGLGGCLD